MSPKMSEKASAKPPMPGAAGAHAGLRVDAGVAVLVVGGALLRVGEDLVGFLGLLELLFGLGIVRIAVRMVLHGQLAVGLLDLVVRGVAVDAEDFVVVAFLPCLIAQGCVRQRPGQGAPKAPASTRPVRTARGGGFKPSCP
jgi:hypothetical protein